VIRCWKAYVEFVAARSSPSTVLATWFDLKVFFAVVGQPVEQVRPVDVLCFITAQRAGLSSLAGTHLSPLAAAEDGVGVSSRTVRPRWSTITPSPMRTFADREDRVGVGGSFEVQGRCPRARRTEGDRDQALVVALAVGDEQLLVPERCCLWPAMRDTSAQRPAIPSASSWRW
jgi:hypothetical protein